MSLALWKPLDLFIWKREGLSAAIKQQHKVKKNCFVFKLPIKSSSLWLWQLSRLRQGLLHNRPVKRYQCTFYSVPLKKTTQKSPQVKTSSDSLIGSGRKWIMRRMQTVQSITRLFTLSASTPEVPGKWNGKYITHIIIYITWKNKQCKQQKCQWTASHVKIPLFK